MHSRARFPLSGAAFSVILISGRTQNAPCSTLKPEAVVRGLSPSTKTSEFS